MEDLAQKIDLKKLDKSDWKVFRFDQIAQKISETVDPKTTNLEIYVGLEHLDAESIHIRRKGVPADVSGGKLRCYPGDIIFGKRRAYQRKAAIVDFDGICSAHAFVLRAIPKVIDPKLFPFFLHSDAFMHRAVDISVGGLSPTINWGHLKEQQFFLPPKEEQAQLAELLWAMDGVVESDLKLLNDLRSSYQIMVDNLFSIPNGNWESKKLADIASINSESLKSKTDPNYRFKYLDIASITEPKVVGDLTEMVFSDSPSRARRKLMDNSIVLSMVRPYQKSFVFIDHGEGIIASTGTGVINVHEGHNPKFVFHQFFSNKFLSYCENRMTGTNYPAITPKDLEQYEISIPTDDQETDECANKLNELDSIILATKSQVSNSQSLQKSLINQIF